MIAPYCEAAIIKITCSVGTDRPGVIFLLTRLRLPLRLRWFWTRRLALFIWSKLAGFDFDVKHQRAIHPVRCPA
jgi:hypothetical protein